MASVMVSLKPGGDDSIIVTTDGMAEVTVTTVIADGDRENRIEVVCRPAAEDKANGR